MKQTLSHIFRPIALGFYALATLALTLTLVLTVSAQEIRMLPADEAVSGQVTDRLGEEWVFAACAGDVVTINMQSDEFSAYLELFPPTGRRSIAEIAAIDDDATLGKVPLDESGEFTVIASGEGRSDQGAYTLMLTYGDIDDDATKAEPADGWLLPDDVISSTIRTRFGEEWAFRGCEGDIIDIDMESENFDAYLELYGPTGRRPLAEDDNGGRKTDALIEQFELEESGTFVIVAGGATRDDTGDYTLALAVEHSEPVESPAATSTATLTLTSVATKQSAPTSIPTVRPTRRPTATRTPTPEPEVCIVQISSLNLRSGPDVVYEPPIGGIPRNAELIPLARNANATWIEVEVATTGRTGWVSSASQYVACTFDPADLPLGVIPSTPTPTVTPSPTPTVVVAVPTPTPPAFVILPGGGNPGPFEGDVVGEAGAFSLSSGTPTFRDRIYFRLLVKERGRSHDGDGVDRVEITVFHQPDNGGDFEVYSRTERTSGFCSFGGGEPNCDVVRIGRDARWPDTNIPIENGVYVVSFKVVKDGDNQSSANWDIPFVISNSDLPSGGQGGNRPDLVARVAQTGPGTTSTSISGRAVFQVEAYDPSRGNRDGDGIDNVDIRILAPDGHEVYQRTENNVAYCAFSGGEPDYEIWDFGASGNQWPSGESLQPGFHRLVARVNADDGRQITVDFPVEIR